MAELERLSTYKMYTIGWIAALSKELTAAKVMLDETHEQPEDFEQNDRDSNAYCWGRIGKHNIVIASLGGGSYGKVSAATTATCMVTSLPHLRFGLLVGIGAGVPRLERGIDIRLGDVVVSVPSNGHPGVIQYDLKKLKESGKVELVGSLAPPPPILLKSLDKLRAEQRFKGSKLPHILDKTLKLYPMLGKAEGKDPPFIYQGAQNDRLFESTSAHRDTASEHRQALSVPPDIPRTGSQMIYYGILRTVAWTWALVCFLLTSTWKVAARNSVPRSAHSGLTEDFVNQEAIKTQTCCYCDHKKEIHRGRRSTNDPEVHYGNVASGDLVVKNGVFRDQMLQGLGIDFLCYEMEAAGLMSNFPCLVIRGICDYADSHKNDRWQNYAAIVAAAYATELLGVLDAKNVEKANKMEELMTKVSEDVSQINANARDTQQTLEFKSITNWLSAPSPFQNHNQACDQHQPGTGQWLLRRQEYQLCKTKPVSSLWLHGIPGCGKTILASVIVNDLKSLETDEKHVIFFYFTFTDTKKQSLDGAIRSLIHQLYCKSNPAKEYFNSIFRSNYNSSLDRPNTTLLQNIFEYMVQISGRVWIVLDALDECRLGTSFKNEGLLPWIQRIVNPKHENVSVIVTSRLEHNIHAVLDKCIAHSISLSADVVADDIHAFIDEAVRTWDGLETWRPHERVQQEIQAHLARNAKGMFRWVSCQLKALARLRGCQDYEALRETLGSLPETLDETYARILSDIPDVFQSKSQRILQFLLYSERPLRLEEAAEIVKMSSKRNTPRRRADSTVQQDINEVRIYCSTLVEVFDESSDVRRGQFLQLAHFSVKEYLLSNRLPTHLPRVFREPYFTRTHSLRSMAEVCLIYLLDIQPNQRLWTSPSTYPLAQYAAEHWVSYACRAGKDLDLELVREFLRHERHYDTYSRYWRLQFSEWNPRAAKYIQSSLTDITDPSSNPAIIHFASKGLACVVKEILRLDVNAPGVSSHCDGLPLQAAALGGHEQVVQILLDHGADVNIVGGRYGNALQAAAHGGHENVVQLLLGEGAQVNLVSGYYGTALQAAALEGHEKIVRILLRRGAQVTAAGGRYGNALQAAARSGHKKIVNELLENGADVNAQCRHHSDYHFDNFNTALEAAVIMGHEKVAGTLLDVGANPNAPGDLLSGAVTLGNIGIVKKLLGKGALVTRGVLNEALDYGSDAAISLLLKNIASAEKVTYLRETLPAACKKGRKDVVCMFIKHGADINAPNLWGCTAISCAAAAGHDRLVQLLLHKGAKPNESRFHPLYTAAEENLVNVMQLITEHAGPDLPCEALHGSLHIAALRANVDAVKFLLSAFQARGQVNFPRDVLNQAFCNAMTGYDNEREYNRERDMMMILLLDHGADVNTTDDANAGVIFRMMSQWEKAKDKEMLKSFIKLLLERGADANTGRGNLGSALDIALRARCWELVGMLIEKGAHKTPTYRFMEGTVKRALGRDQNVEDVKPAAL